MLVNIRSNRTILIVIWCILWGGLTGRAEIQEIRLLVEGLDIDARQARLDQELRQIEGMAAVDIFPDEDLIILKAKSGQPFSLEKVESVVLSMGFSLQYWILTASGELGVWREKPAFLIPENNIELWIEGVSEEAEQKLEKLLKQSAPGSRFTATGILQTVRDPQGDKRIVKMWIEKASDVR